MSPQPVIRIIGIGSPFGADRTGWELVAALGRALPGLPRGVAAETVLCRAPAADLPGHLRGVQAVVLVDAVRDGRAPGTVCAVSGGSVARRHPRLSGHGIGLGDVLDLVCALGEGPRSVSLLGVSVAGEGVPLTRAGRRRALDAVRRRIERIAAELESVC